MREGAAGSGRASGVAGGGATRRDTSGTLAIAELLLPLYSWWSLAGPCGASGAADARERAKLAQLVKFQNLRSRSAYQRT